MGAPWTDDRVALLKRIARLGGSYSDAARALDLTRAAIAGKSHREGVSFRCELTRDEAATLAARGWPENKARSPPEGGALDRLLHPRTEGTRRHA